MEMFLLRDLIVVTPAEEIESCSVLIENGRISQILPNDNAGQPVLDQNLSLQGARLFAGYVDVHNHGAVGVDANSASADELHEVSKFLAKNGVTAWLPSLVPDSEANYQKSIGAIDELMRTQDAREAAARVIGVHYEGPFVNENQCGALRVRYFKDFAKGDEINSLPKLKTPNAVHLITLAPEIEGGIELIKALGENGWVVSIGHTRADVETLERALGVGARHLTHFFNAMSGLHHRNVGVVGWGLTRNEATFDIIGDGVHVHPAMLAFACRAKTPEKVILISDSVSPAGLGDGQFEIWGEPISVINGKTQNARGSIAGSVITVHDAVKNLFGLGFSAGEISLMASFNPAKLLGIENQCGSIEVGKRADLVAIDADGNVVLTLVGGKIAFRLL